MWLSNSSATKGWSPSFLASWPGSITYTLPAVSTISVPSSWVTVSDPDWTTPTWRV
ncbi:MAG: hypothetical protein U0P47_10310 [Acidimicrobiales bacterium]